MQILSVHTPRIKLYRSEMSLVPSKDMIKLDSWVCKSFLSFIMMKTHKHLGSQAARISFKFLQPFKPIYICITAFIFLYIYIYMDICLVSLVISRHCCPLKLAWLIGVWFWHIRFLKRIVHMYIYIYLYAYIYRYAFDKVLFEYGFMALYILNVSRYHQVLLSRHTKLC